MYMWILPWLIPSFSVHLYVQLLKSMCLVGVPPPPNDIDVHVKILCTAVGTFIYSASAPFDYPSLFSFLVSMWYDVFVLLQMFFVAMPRRWSLEMVVTSGTHPPRSLATWGRGLVPVTTQSTWGLSSYFSSWSTLTSSCTTPMRAPVSPFHQCQRSAKKQPQD